jgi:tRNA(Ile)-lysidine synthase
MRGAGKKLCDILARTGARRLVAGLSGGADSLALTVFLSEQSPPLNFELEAVHFQHHLRGAESDGDERFCRDFCAARGIKLQVVSLDVKGAREAGGAGVEEAARELRLEAWAKIIPESARRETAAALGHNSGDRTENLLIRLFRGSNSSGLSSMRPVQKIGGVTFVRPLLGISRAEIAGFLKSRGITEWREDSSNKENVYLRNLLRNKIIPEISEKIPFASAGAAQSLRALSDDADFLESAAGTAYKTAPDPDATVFWRGLHPALLIRVLGLWLREKSGEPLIPGAALAERFSAALRQAPDSGGEAVLIPAGPGRAIMVARGGCSLVKTEKNGAVPESVFWRPAESPVLSFGGGRLRADLTDTGAATPEGNLQAVFDAGALPDGFFVSVRADGDRMTPFGSDKSVSLKKLFSSAKIYADGRLRHPVLRLSGPSGEILWAAGVRRSNLAPVTQGTRRVLRLSFEPDAGGPQLSEDLPGSSLR